MRTAVEPRLLTCASSPLNDRSSVSCIPASCCCGCPASYSDEKVANRDTKVWHFVIEIE
jgi:hypothetical protein